MEDNKDYILNIRVSRETYNKLKHKAKENSESLSSLVRKSLDDSWEIFTDLKQDIIGSKKPSDNVMHYQKVILAQDTNCNRCSRVLDKDSQIFVGETKT